MVLKLSPTLVRFAFILASFATLHSHVVHVSLVSYFSLSFSMSCSSLTITRFKLQFGRAWKSVEIPRKSYICVFCTASFNSGGKSDLRLDYIRLHALFFE